jgi:RNA polymerase sigma factor (sigma-70 family)
MTDRLGPMVRRIQREAHAELSDRELLALFGRQGQSAAFEELVRWHGGLVFGVCRRVVGNHHDAEDAFQATFCVLARKAKAGQIARPDALPNWLYGVAYNVARKAKAKGVQRRAKESEKERRAVAQREERSASEAAAREWREVLDEELNRLPSRYRALVIQCDLEGKTMQEAAELHGCPVGTVKGQLSRARELLRQRLVRRGLTAAGSALSGWLAEEAAAAAPPALVAATVRGVAAWAAGGGAEAFSGSVVALTEEMMRSLLMNKIKIVAALVTAAALVLGSAGGYFAWAGKPGPPTAAQQGAAPAPGDDKPGPGEAAAPRADDEPKEFEVALVKRKPLAADPKDDELRKLLKERFNAALGEVQAAHERVLAGQIGAEGLFDATSRLKHAGLEVFDEPKKQIALLEQFVELAKEVERIIDLREQAGRATVEEVQRVRYFRIDAEIALLRLKTKPGEKPK